MRTAIVAYECGEGFVGGLATHCVSTPKMFKELGECHFIVPSKSGRKSKSRFEVDKFVKYSDLAETLNSYDFVFFLSAGPAREKTLDHDYLQKLTVPFITGCYDDNDWQLYGHAFPKFFEAPMFKGLLVLNDHFLDSKPPEFKPSNVKEIQQICDPDLFKDKPAWYGNPALLTLKFPLVVSTARWTPFKLVDMLCMVAPLLRAKGIETELYGLRHVFQFQQDIEARFPVDWIYKGVTKDVSAALVPAKFHFNMIGRKKRKCSPRLELSSIEAVRDGCIPIVSDEFTPTWFKSAIRIPASHYLAARSKISSPDLTDPIVSAIDEHLRHGNERNYELLKGAWDEIEAHFHHHVIREQILELAGLNG